jgi:hypothetical protein
MKDDSNIEGRDRMKSLIAIPSLKLKIGDFFLSKIRRYIDWIINLGFECSASKLSPSLFLFTLKHKLTFPEKFNRGSNGIY